MAGISNIGLSSGQYSTYGYTTTPENLISAITETSDSSTVYPSALTQTASYNNLNQLTNLSGQALSFDTNGNLLSDGQRNYSWDVENRLIGISYPGQSGKQTAFTYDGLSQASRDHEHARGRQCDGDFVWVVWKQHLSGSQCQ